jgi:hypothetical protein
VVRVAKEDEPQQGGVWILVSDGSADLLSVTKGEPAMQLLKETDMADESNKQDHRLVSGVFSPEEANRILMSLLEDKINFHKRNIWSHRERFGKGDISSEKRIGELQQTKADISRLLDNAASSGAPLAIRCNIEISLAQQ